MAVQSVEAAREIGAARVVPKRVMRTGIVENIFATSVDQVRSLLKQIQRGAVNT